MTPALYVSGGFAAHDLIEVAAIASRSFLLVEKRQPALIKFLEELFPGDRLQASFPAVPGKIDPEYTDVLARAGGLHVGRFAPALLCPAPDRFVILSRLGKIGHNLCFRFLPATLLPKQRLTEVCC